MRKGRLTDQQMIAMLRERTGEPVAALAKGPWSASKRSTHGRKRSGWCLCARAALSTQYPRYGYPAGGKDGTAPP